MPTNEDSRNISLSSVETQRRLRVEKMDKLRAAGHHPYAVKSARDFNLDFVKFWFDFVHDYDLKKFQEEYPEPEMQYFFLDQVFFPSSLVEKMEERLFVRQMTQNSGLDLSDNPLIQEFEEKDLNEVRRFFPNLFKISEEKREYFLTKFFSNFDKIEAGAENKLEISIKQGQKVSLAGRIKSKRVSGKIAFATVEDESLPEGFQYIFRRDLIEEQLPNAKVEDGNAVLSFEDLKTLIDEGDYIQARGYLDKSQRGEPSLFVESYQILTKALRPLPETLDYENVEERYTNRVVDFKMNTLDDDGRSVRDLVRLKQKYWSIWREEMVKEGFLEVECPIFEHIPGGAEAKPFTTFYNELDQEVYLRISLELPLKKLIAGGFEKVFEIGRIFRNEGSSPQHLQEYTQIEWYWAYADYTDGMKLVKRVYQRVVQEVLGKLTQTDYYGHEINWGEWCSLTEAQHNGWGLASGDQIWEPGTREKSDIIMGWPIIPYFDAVRYYSGGKVDFEGKTFDQLMQIAKEFKVEIEPGTGIAGVMDKIYKKLARPNIHHPIFLALVPVELEPLAKRHPADPSLTERWQVVAGTAELGKCFTELNDPIDQFGRFEDQQAARDAGDEEAQFMDENYVKALELGTPPMAGFGTSERFLSFLLGKHIKECVTFPHVRSEDNQVGKSKRTMVAHAVILDNPDVPMWSKLNAAAHLSASFGAREGKKLIHLEESESKDGERIPMNIQHAIVMKKTDTAENLRKLKKLAEEEKLVVTVFTKEMRDSSDDDKVTLAHSQKTNEEVGYLGVLVYGRKSEVEKLTEGFEKV